MHKNKRIHSLAVRQAKTVFLVSVMLGVCFSLYHIIVDLHQEQDRIEDFYQVKLLQNYSNASQAAYHLNSLLAEQVASNLMMDSAIYNVKIIDDFGDTLTHKVKNPATQGAFTRLLADYLIPENPVYTTELHQPNSHIVVGTLSFSVNGNSIANAFVAKTSKVLLFDLLRNIILTSILLLFFYQKLSKPLVTLMNWVKSLQDYKNYLPPPAQYRDDEIGHLAETIHTLWREREAAEDKLNQLAYYDSLTGLANRSLLMKLLANEIEASKAHHQTGALFYLDLDRFKTINDSLGHTIGDNLLKAISRRLKSWLRREYSAARIGGDEFAILLPNTSAEEARELAQQLMSLISNPYTIDGHQLYCSISVGVALFADNDLSNIDVLRQADTALYRAKVAGKNKYVFYEVGMHAQVESFLEIERGLHEALNNEQLELFYQPQVDSQHRIVGAEALIRWRHPEKGLLYPDLFMPIAEETGQIMPIGNWIIEKACYQFASWKNSGCLPDSFQRLAINISPLQFAQDGFVEHISGALAQAGITGDNIELEITENLLLENAESIIEKMLKLKELNVKISIDDFGTGYSSLRYLKHLSVDVLKIDRSFVTQLHLDESDQAIVDTIIMTAKRLNLDVIAEGVEDVHELETLKQLGCYHFQGYLFDKPLPATELEQRFQHNLYVVESAQKQSINS